MTQLTEKDFAYIKSDLQNGRLSMSGMRLFLIGAFVFSLIMVGIALFWAMHAPFWDSIKPLFIVEAVLLAIQLLILLSSLTKNNVAQLMLSFSMIIFAYKMVLDPFILLFLMFVGYEVYDVYAPITFILMGLGILLHIYFIVNEFIYLKARKKKRKKKKETKISFVFVGFIFFIVSITGYAVRNNLFGDFETLFFLVIVFIIYFAVLYGAVDFIIAAYCLVRFPSFRINPPKQKHYRKHHDKKMINKRR